MRENRIQSIWRDGGSVINGWLTIPSAFAAETMAHQGWDSLTVDSQHGVVDYQVAVTMLQAISTTPLVPLARVPWLDSAMIMKMLDAGAYGLICPMINSRADAEALVGACRYPPQGFRSFGPLRAMLYAGADYAQHANETILAIAQIETAEAIDNIEEIVTVPGLDAVYIGPVDLGLSLGYPPQFDHTEPTIVDAIDKVVDAATRHGVIAGIHNATPTYARQMIEKGFRFVTVLSDARIMAAAARQLVADIRGRDGEQTASAGPSPAASAQHTRPS